MTALHVLLVEDNAMNAELVMSLLEMEGHTVELARDGRALRAWQRGPKRPQVVLMDILLPDAEGTKLLHELQQDLRFDGVPIVAFTAHAPGDAAQLVRQGFAGVLTKPIDTNTFVATVASFARP